MWGGPLKQEQTLFKWYAPLVWKLYMICQSKSSFFGTFLLWESKMSARMPVGGSWGYGGGEELRCSGRRWHHKQEWEPKIFKRHCLALPSVLTVLPIFLNPLTLLPSYVVAGERVFLQCLRLSSKINEGSPTDGYYSNTSYMAKELQHCPKSVQGWGGG